MAPTDPPRPVGEARLPGRPKYTAVASSVNFSLEITLYLLIDYVLTSLELLAFILNYYGLS